MFYKTVDIAYALGVTNGILTRMSGLRTEYYRHAGKEIAAVMELNEAIKTLLKRTPFYGGRVPTDWDIDGFGFTTRVFSAFIAAENGSEQAKTDLKLADCDIDVNAVGQLFLSDEIAKIRWMNNKYPTDEFIEGLVRITLPLVNESSSVCFALSMALAPLTDVLNWHLHHEKLYTYTLKDDKPEYLNWSPTTTLYTQLKLEVHSL